MAIGEGTAWGLESLFRINGLVLNDQNQKDRYVIETVAGLMDDPEIKAQQGTTNPNDHGELPVGNPLYDGRTIVLRGHIEASTSVKLRSMQRALKRAIPLGISTLYIEPDVNYRYQSTIMAGDGDTAGWNWYGEPGSSGAGAMVPVQLSVRKGAATIQDESQSNMKMQRPFMITLRAPNPRILSQTLRTKTITIVSGTSAGTGTVSQRGDFPAQATVRFIGPHVQNPRLNNAANGRSLKTLLLSIANGSWVEYQYDGAKRRVIDSAGVIRPSAFDSTGKYMLLETGDNSLTLVTTANGVPPTAVQVSFRDTWI